MAHHKSSIVYTCTNRIYRPKKYFYVSLGNNFTVFCGSPLVVEALGNCPVCSLLNPALCKRRKQRIRKTTQTYTTYTIYYTTLLETVQYKKRKSIFSASEVTTLWRYTNLLIIIIIINSLSKFFRGNRL